MSINISYQDEILIIKCSGSNFYEQIEEVKNLGAHYNAKSKLWEITAGKFDDVFNSLNSYGIDISEYDKIEIKKYFDNLDESEVITKRSDIRKFKQELLNYGPVHEFQLQDLIFQLNRNSALATWDTGMGKSWLTAGLLSHLRYYGEVDKALILTSPIGILNLSNELKKFIKNYDESKTLIVKSVTQLKDRLVFTDEWDIIICGYDAFRSIGDAYDKVLNSRTKKVKYRKSPLPLQEWFGNKKGIIFLDECHFLGSPSSLRSKFINMNIPFFKYRYLTSATPADKEEKMYMILKLLNKKLVKGLDYNGWLGEFCQLGTRFSKYGVNKDTWDYQKWAELQHELYKNYAVKREKSLLGLPPEYEVPIIQINMSKAHREIYEAFTYSVVNDIKQQSQNNGMTLVENLANSFQLLQLAVDNPLCLLTTPRFKDFSYELQQAVKKFNYEKDFERLKALDSVIEEECIENDNKIIISYYHPITLECLKSHLKTGFHVVSAETPKEDRFDVIEDFKKSSNKILLASINILNNSFSLNECKAEVMYELTFNYTNVKQFKGRILRIGQTEEVRYYKFVYNNSIDNIIHLNLESKGRVLQNLIKKNTLSAEEWKLVVGGESNAQSSFLS